MKSHFWLIFGMLLSLTAASNNYISSQQINSFGDAGYSSMQSSSGGNNIIISRHLGPDQEPEEYISVSVPSIKIDGEYFSCSSLICPKETFKCVVTSEAISTDKNQMKTTVECFDKSGITLETKQYTEKNPFPNVEPPFSRHTTVDRDGSVSTEDSNGQSNFNSKKMSQEEQDKMLKTMKEETDKINSQIQEHQRQFQEQMNQFQNQMQNAFGNGFPFGNAGFQQAQNFPFYYPTYTQPNYPLFPYYNGYNSYTSYPPTDQRNHFDYYNDDD